MSRTARSAAVTENARKPPPRPTTLWGVRGAWERAAPSSNVSSDAVDDRDHAGLVLDLPARVITPTVGFDEYSNTRVTAPLPVCQHHHRERCTRGVACPDLHADRNFVEAALAASSTANSRCCAACGDPFSLRTIADVPALREFGFTLYAVPPDAYSVLAEALKPPPRGEEDAVLAPHSPSTSERVDDAFQRCAVVAELAVTQLAITLALQRGESAVCDAHVTATTATSSAVDDDGGSAERPRAWGCPLGKDCPKYHPCRAVLAQARASLPDAKHVLLLRIHAAAESVGGSETTTSPGSGSG